METVSAKQKPKNELGVTALNEIGEEDLDVDDAFEEQEEYFELVGYFLKKTKVKLYHRPVIFILLMSENF